MKIQNTARHVGASNYSKSAARVFESRWWLDRPFAKDQRTGGPAHIADVLPAVLRNLSAAGHVANTGGAQ